MGVTVQAPDGRVWRIRRSIAWPRYRWLDDEDERLGGWLLGGADVTSAGGFIISLFFLAFFAVFIFVFLPPLLFIAEGALAVAAAVFALRPWRITAESGSKYMEWRVRGWRRSRRAAREIAQQLAVGTPPVERW